MRSNEEMRRMDEMLLLEEVLTILGNALDDARERANLGENVDYTHPDFERGCIEIGVLGPVIARIARLHE